MCFFGSGATLTRVHLELVKEVGEGMMFFVHRNSE